VKDDWCLRRATARCRDAAVLVHRLFAPHAGEGGWAMAHGQGGALAHGGWIVGAHSGSEGIL